MPFAPLSPPLKCSLEDHREEEGFTPACRDEMEASIARRAADFRLDAPLRAACAGEVESLCGEETKALKTTDEVRAPDIVRLLRVGRNFLSSVYHDPTDSLMD